MLKIKDNVDLKELEKYGFKRHKKAYYRCQRNDYYFNTPHGAIEIQKYTGWISHNGTSFLRTDEIIFEDKLYDLIKAGLVEKIDK